MTAVTEPPAATDPKSSDTQSHTVVRSRGSSPARNPWRRRLLTGAAVHGAVIVVVLATFELLSGRYVSELTIPKPSSIGRSAVTWLEQGYLQHHLLYTVQTVGIGFVIGSLLGFVVAVVFTEIGILGRFGEPYILAISVIPAIALVPLFVSWLGLGIGTKIVMGIFTAFCVVFVTSYAGLRSVDARLLELGRLYHASRWQLLTTIRLPGGTPHVFSGAKLALPKVALAVVVTEYLAGNTGLGYVILRSGNLLDIGGMFVGIIALTVAVHLMAVVIIGVERVALRWVPKESR